MIYAECLQGGESGERKGLQYQAYAPGHLASGLASLAWLTFQLLGVNSFVCQALGSV
jgi:hypothetical protein